MPKTASASLVSTVNISYLHAPPPLSPSPCICVCVPSVSLSSAFLSLSLFCASFWGILGANYWFYWCALLARLAAFVRFQNWSRTRSSLTVSTDHMRRNKRSVLFGSDLRSRVPVLAPARAGPPLWLRVGVFKQARIVAHDVLRVVTQRTRTRRINSEPAEPKM